MRPKFNDGVRQQLANEYGQKLLDWAGWSDEELQACIDTCHKVFEFHSDDDGYEICRELERHGFYPESDLVEIMDGVSWDRSKLIEELVKKWVQENGIKPDLPIGTSVTFSGHNGTIVGFDEARAMYKVQVEKKTYIVPYEEVKEV